MYSQAIASKTLSFAAVMLCLCNLVQADIITFGSVNAPLPYTESGYVVTSLSGSNAIIQQIGNLSNRILSLGVQSQGQQSNLRLTASNGGAFNLVSLQLIGSSAFSWDVIGSNGSTLTIPSNTGAGTLNFTLLGDWTNLTSVNFVHTAGQVNANLQMDNINVAAVPEPSCLAITALAALMVVRRGMRKAN